MGEKGGGGLLVLHLALTPWALVSACSSKETGGVESLPELALKGLGDDLYVGLRSAWPHLPVCQVDTCGHGMIISSTLLYLQRVLD